MAAFTSGGPPREMVPWFFTMMVPPSRARKVQAVEPVHLQPHEPAARTGFGLAGKEVDARFALVAGLEQTGTNARRKI